MRKRFSQKVFIGEICLRGEIILKTGLHIGGSEEAVQIGEVTPIIKDPATGFPYIPGSSLKGKLRSIMETFGKRERNGKEERVPINKRVGTPRNPVYIHCCDDLEMALNCDVCRVFGMSGEKGVPENLPASLLCRDANLDPAKQEIASFMDIKTENVLDRVTAVSNPRRIERVIPGAKFDLEMILQVFALGDDKQLSFPKHLERDLGNLFTCMAILETQGLGGLISRGYGKVKFHFNELSALRLEYFKRENEEKKNILKCINEREFGIDKARKHIPKIVEFMKTAFEEITGEKVADQTKV